MGFWKSLLFRTWTPASSITKLKSLVNEEMAVVLQFVRLKDCWLLQLVRWRWLFTWRSLVIDKSTDRVERIVRWIYLWGSLRQYFHEMLFELVSSVVHHIKRIILPTQRRRLDSRLLHMWLGWSENSCSCIPTWAAGLESLGIWSYVAVYCRLS